MKLHIHWKFFNSFFLCNYAQSTALIRPLWLLYWSVHLSVLFSFKGDKTFHIFIKGYIKNPMDTLNQWRRHSRFFLIGCILQEWPWVFLCCSSGSNGRVTTGAREPWNLCCRLWRPSFMTLFYRARREGMAPSPPGSATALWEISCSGSHRLFSFEVPTWLLRYYQRKFKVRGY